MGSAWSRDATSALGRRPLSTSYALIAWPVSYGDPTIRIPRPVLVFLLQNLSDEVKDLPIIADIEDQTVGSRDQLIPLSTDDVERALRQFGTERVGLAFARETLRAYQRAETDEGKRADLAAVLDLLNEEGYQ